MKPQFWLSGTWLALSACLSLTACQPKQDDAGTTTTAQATAEPAAQSADAKQPAAAQALVDTEFNPKLLDYIKTLSADEFQGRAPATKGEEKTLAYLSGEFKRIGLKPLADGSYVQPVQLVRIDPVEVSSMTFSGDKAPATMKYRDQMFVWSTRVTEFSEIKESELVFGGSM